MKSLADDLYEYTTVRQSQTTMSMSELHVNSMLEQVAASFELEAEKKNIQLNVETTPADITMEADAEKMGRVFNNLVSNALKYGNGATNINLIATRKDVDKIVIRVENDGEPIPNDALTKIFERFYRVETSRSVETGGTGLGLAITQSIIELHHGKISVTSDEALTAFIIELPLKQEERED